MDSNELAYHVAKLSLEKKAHQVTILDLREITTITDYFVICSADSDIQVKAISDHLTDNLEKEKIRIWHIEGLQSLTWVLMDIVEVVIHIFQPEFRKYYSLEKLWGDAKFIEVKDEY